MDNLFVLEWSKKQNAFHIQTAMLTVEKNLNVLLAGDETDYVPIMIGTREECEIVQRRYRNRLKKESPALKSWQIYKRH